jgi:hypothetical protein
VASRSRTAGANAQYHRRRRRGRSASRSRGCVCTHRRRVDQQQIIRCRDENRCVYCGELFPVVVPDPGLWLANTPISPSSASVSPRRRLKYPAWAARERDARDAAARPREPPTRRDTHDRLRHAQRDDLSVGDRRLRPLCHKSPTKHGPSRGINHLVSGV